MSEIYKDLDKLYEKIEKIENENKKLHSIIKEVREYIEERYQVKGTMVYDSPIYHKDILEILDKGSDEISK